MAETNAYTGSFFAPNSSVSAYYAQADSRLDPGGAAIATVTADARGTAAFPALPSTVRLFVTDGVSRRYTTVPSPEPVSGGGGTAQRWIVGESDLDPTLQAKVDSRTPAGRVAQLGNLGASGTVTLTDADDQGQVDVFLTLTADGVLEVDGVATVTRCTLRIVVTQDATGNHGLDIRNGTTGDQATVLVDSTAAAATFIYAYVDDSTNLNIVGPTALPTDTGGSGLGLPTITGTLRVGEVLTATPPAGLTGVSYQWQRSTDNGQTWASISGATSSTYTQQVADEGNKVTVLVTGTPSAQASPVIVPNTDLSVVGTIQQSTTKSSTNVVLRPAEAITGDVLYAVITCTGGTAQTHSSVPAGWNLVGRYVNSSGNFVQFVYWRRDDGTAGPWSFPGTSSQTYRSRTVAVRNAAASGTPHELVTQANGSFNTTVTLPSLTPSSGTGRMYLGVVSFPQSVGITWPDGTVTDASGSDYGKFAYESLGTSTSATAVVNGTASATVHKSVVALLILQG